MENIVVRYSIQIYVALRQSIYAGTYPASDHVSRLHRLRNFGPLLVIFVDRRIVQKYLSLDF